MTGGAGADTIVFADAGGVAYTIAAAGATVADGDVFTLAGGAGNAVTTVTDFAAGDILNTVNATAAVSGRGATVTAANNVGASITYFFSGNWNSANNTFTVTVDGAGSSTLLLTDGGNAGAANAILFEGTNSAVLAGASYI